MAIKAFATLRDFEPGSDRIKITLYIKYVVLGADRGDFIPGEVGEVTVTDLDVSNRQSIEALVDIALKTNIASHGITMEPQDTVFIW